MVTVNTGTHSIAKYEVLWKWTQILRLGLYDQVCSGKLVISLFLFFSCNFGDSHLYIQSIFYFVYSF